MKTYSVSQASTVFQYSEGEILAFLNSGELTGFRLGNHVLFTEKDMQRFIQKHGSSGFPIQKSVFHKRLFWAVSAMLAALFVLSSFYPNTLQNPLFDRQVFENPVDNAQRVGEDLNPPLNTSVKWERKHFNPAAEGTQQLLSLIYQNESEKKSYPWPLYVQLYTKHSEGDAVGSYVRLIKEGTGWGAAFHTDMYLKGEGTSIGSNIEITKKEPKGRAIGLNVLNIGHWAQQAINLGSSPGAGWETGINFEPQSFGTRGLWMQGKYTVGIDMEKNDIRFHRGGKLILEETGQVYLLFNPANSRIEFHYGNKVLGFLDLNASPHAL